MSPEQVMGDEIDPRTDIFSSGAVFYEMLSNKKPFDADSVHGILFQVVHKQPTPVRELSRELPAIVAEVVDKALAKDRANRFQTATEFREALGYISHALASGRPQEARLSKAGDKTLSAGSAPPAPPRPSPPTSGGEPVVDGTVALDIKVPDRRPASSPRLSSGNRTRPPGLSSSARRLETQPKRSGHGVGIAILVSLVLAGGAAFYFRDQLPAIPFLPHVEVQSGPNVAEQALKHALVSTKLELARAKLDDKDYKAALETAQEVLRLDPKNANAKRLLEGAEQRVGEIEKAAADALFAAQAGDNERAGAALSKLLTLDPKHPTAVQVSAQLNSLFQRQAEEARGVAVAARAEAAKAGAEKNEGFSQAVELVKVAEAQFRKGSYADAARGYLESRDSFERARRAALATPVPPPPTQPPAAATEAPPVVTAAPAVVTTVPPTEPPVVASAGRRPLVVGPNVLQNRPAGSGVAGFEGASVQKATDMQARIEIELSRTDVRAGDAYIIKATFTNIGRKSVRIKEAALTFNVNGRSRVEPITPDPVDVSPQQGVDLVDTGGVWEEGIETWSLQVAVTSDKGEVCRRDVRLR
jgi:tetratricopeptide (TPR) repeat protein